MLGVSTSTLASYQAVGSKLFELCMFDTKWLTGMTGLTRMSWNKGKIKEKVRVLHCKMIFRYLGQNCLDKV